uniref:Uncharacterized protein n=1 Tax=Ananas comosus var. bracteatus TaxID=296719 RepID=A0A6V7Q2A9_ANACO|nr:unnamed protein product [Ananas comosus var. bracteatus]
MADDNAINLRNRAIPRNSGSEQPSNSENVVERQAVLPAEGETSGQSGQQEPSLAQALGQMTRVLQVLDQNSHASTARLDAVLAAITASNENIARMGQLLTRNDQPTLGLIWPHHPLSFSFLSSHSLHTFVRERRRRRRRRREEEEDLAWTWGISFPLLLFPPCWCLKAWTWSLQERRSSPLELGLALLRRLPSTPGEARDRGKGVASSLLFCEGRVDRCRLSLVLFSAVVLDALYVLTYGGSGRATGRASAGPGA